MSKKVVKAMTKKERADKLLDDAEDAWLEERNETAFRLFLAAAEAGNKEAYDIVAQFYHFGTGTERNEEAALRWYRRAARYGEGSAANNIGCIWRDRGNIGRAISWFQKAIDYEWGCAVVNLAKVYMNQKPDTKAAKHYLEIACKANWVDELDKEEARELLRDLK